MRIRRLESDHEARVCARMRASMDPWITLGRGYEAGLKAITDPTREVYVAVSDSGVIAGFMILCMAGAFVGYLQTICIGEEHRGKGLGTEMIRFAEERILKETPNVFLCVSSFNRNAERLYRRLGYERIGELKDFIVEGHAEILFRKTTGPLAAGPKK
jgi:ribosomal protein S18 acetylase RimI-like enzyme